MTPTLTNPRLLLTPLPLTDTEQIQALFVQWEIRWELTAEDSRARNPDPQKANHDQSLRHLMK